MGKDAAVDNLFADIRRGRAEAAMHREKAEFYIEEAQKCRTEMEDRRAEAERRREEAAAYQAKEDPRNMSLRQVLKALPGIITSRVRNQAGKRSER